MFIHFLLCRLTLKSRCPLCPQLFCKILYCDTVWYASTISHILYSVNAYFANCILEISRVCMSICRSYMYIYKYIMIYNYTFMYRQVALSDSPLEAASMLLSSLFLFITKMWKPENCRIWSWHLHTSYVMEGDVARLWLLRSVVNAPQNWLIEEFYMVRCERQCMNLEENQSAKFIKVVTAAEHTRCTLLHCLFSTLLVQVLSTAGIFDLHTRLSANGIQSGWNNPIQQQLCLPDGSEGKPPWAMAENWLQGIEIVSFYIVFMSNIWLGVEEIRSIQLFTVRECSNVRPFRTWSLKRETFTKLSPTRSTVPWPWHRAIWMTLLAGY